IVNATLRTCLQTLFNGCVGNSHTSTIVWQWMFPTAIQRIMDHAQRQQQQHTLSSTSTLPTSSATTTAPTPAPPATDPTATAASPATPTSAAHTAMASEAHGLLCLVESLVHVCAVSHESVYDDLLGVQGQWLWWAMVAHWATVLFSDDDDDSTTEPLTCDWMALLTAHAIDGDRFPAAYEALSHTQRDIHTDTHTDTHRERDTQDITHPTATDERAADGHTAHTIRTNHLVPTVLPWFLVQTVEDASRVVISTTAATTPTATDANDNRVIRLTLHTVTYVAQQAVNCIQAVLAEGESFWSDLEAKKPSAVMALTRLNALLAAMCAITAAVHTYGNLIRLLGNVASRNSHAQDQLRESEGLVLFLNHCQLDDRNPYIKEWAVLALRNALEGNKRNQQLVAGMEKNKVVVDPDLGMEVNIDPSTGKLKIKRDGEGSKQQTHTSGASKGPNHLPTATGRPQQHTDDTTTDTVDTRSTTAHAVTHSHAQWSAQMNPNALAQDDHGDDVWQPQSADSDADTHSTDGAESCADTHMGVVLQSAKYISDNSTHVHVLPHGIAKAAHTIATRSQTINYSTAAWKQHELHPDVADDNALNWIFVIDTLNFSFWSATDTLYTVIYRNKPYTGYWALCAAINRALDEGIPITTPSYYAHSTEQQVAHVFRSDSTEPPPLLHYRHEHLTQCGQVLLKDYKGKVSELIASCNGSAETLMNTMVTKFPCYNDISTYRERECAFYKRAQIFVADVWACFEQTGYGHFSDIECITMFADYRVPQVLVYLGLMEYTEELTADMKSGSLWQTGDPREAEVRGCSIWAVELVKREMRRQGCASELNSILLDFYLWDYAKQYSHDMAHVPIHLVRTRFY
ncbi:hypothetical protein SARC_06058, partial [Sphaeroforma arctica JP610]